MHQQTKFILILSGLIAFLLIGSGIIGLVYWQQQAKVQTNTNTLQNTNQQINTNSATQNINSIVNTNASENTNTVEPNVQTLGEAQAFLEQLARSFTERYGSFSNQNNYENLRDLKIYMTEKMQKEVESYISKAEKEVTDNAEYYGITTRVLSIKQERFADDSAVYQLTTQRQEAKGLTGKEKTYQQTGTLEFKKVNANWKVQSFIWN